MYNWPESPPCRCALVSDPCIARFIDRSYPEFITLKRMCRGYLTHQYSQYASPGFYILFTDSLLRLNNHDIGTAMFSHQCESRFSN